MTTTELRLKILRDDWQRSNDRILDLSRLVGRDHTQVTIMIAREMQTRQTLKQQILAITPQE
jgi:hypothetical protein